MLPGPRSTPDRRRAGSSASLDLFWLPLGAGDTTGLVRRSGAVYEAIVARRQRRRRRALFHSALAVQLDGRHYVVEMTPRWGLSPVDRGVVVQGPVGARVLGRSPLFRYEVHLWENGVIPDLDEAVGGGRRLSTDEHRVRRLLEAVPRFPAATWGRDEQETGEMWNSNSLTSWLLHRSGLPAAALAPPRQGRAPGWTAGLVVAARDDQPDPVPRGGRTPAIWCR